MKINDNFLKIESSYLFSTVAKKQREYQAAHPEADVIRLSIGDVTKPLVPAVIDAMHKAVDEMANEETFRGYPPEYGYDFILEAIRKNDYTDRGIDIDLDEIFLSDGAKSDCGNIGDIFSVDNKVAICDPVYPVYIDTNVMAGRSGNKDENNLWDNIIYMPCTAENNFTPDLPNEVPDVIYLCFPNNPTGMVATKEQLKKWVDYALEHKSLILFDSAYESFVVDKDIPKSIYEIEGAKKCAIELRSFSKTAGFTGTRCGYTIIPRELERDGHNIYNTWYRRQATKFNGVSWPVQCAAAAVFSEEGQKQIKENISYYQDNAKIISSAMDELGIYYTGGKNSPYIWLKCPNDMGSWEFFDLLLNEANVVGTPGEGFGKNGAGYFRLTSFGDRENTIEAVERIKKLLSK